MDRFFRKLHEHHCPPGLERAIWRRLPLAAFGSIFLPICLSVAMRVLPPEGTAEAVEKATKTVDFFALGLAVTLLTGVFTVAIGCVVVMIMKGPAYVADAYDLNAAEEPAPHLPSEVTQSKSPTKPAR
jgi:hypothetical protein